MAMLNWLALVALFAVVAGQPFRFGSNGQLDGRIVGGEATTIDQAPYQVSILHNGHLLCGGSIISEEWILTAAHCVSKDTSKFTIRVGSTKHAEDGSVHEVIKITPHEEYHFDYGLFPRNDIALMRVKQPIVLNENTQPIELYNPDEQVQAGEIGVITGWGYDGKSYPDILRTTEIPIIDISQCYPEIRRPTEAQICAASPKGGKDACQGDSGGPLAIDGRLAGITSWGVGCAHAGMPGVYTKISHFRTWVKENSGV